MTDISFVPNQFAIYEFDEGFIFQWASAVHIARSKHKVQKFSFLVTYKMELKAKEPSRGTFVSCCYPIENLVHLYFWVTAYSWQILNIFSSVHQIICKYRLQDNIFL